MRISIIFVLQIEAVENEHTWKIQSCKKCTHIKIVAIENIHVKI